MTCQVAWLARTSTPLTLRMFVRCSTQDVCQVGRNPFVWERLEGEAVQEVVSDQQLAKREIQRRRASLHDQRCWLAAGDTSDRWQQHRWITAQEDDSVEQMAVREHDVSEREEVEAQPPQVVVSPPLIRGPGRLSLCGSGVRFREHGHADQSARCRRWLHGRRGVQRCPASPVRELYWRMAANSPSPHGATEMASRQLRFGHLLAHYDASRTRTDCCQPDPTVANRR